MKGNIIKGSKISLTLALFKNASSSLSQPRLPFPLELEGPLGGPPPAAVLYRDLEGGIAQDLDAFAAPSTPAPHGLLGSSPLVSQACRA